MRMRTIDQCAAYMKEKDPETALTKTAIRRLVVTGALPSVMIGSKYLVSLEALETYLAGERPAVQPAPGYGQIRPINS